MKKQPKNVREKKETKSRRVKILLIVATLIFVVALAGFLISLLGWFAANLETREIFASVKITTDRGGFDLNASALTFGEIKIGGSSTRNVIFQNKYEFPVLVVISAEGSIKPFLSFDDAVLVNVNETKKIGFSVVSSIDTEPGTYSGKVKFKIRRAD